MADPAKPWLFQPGNPGGPGRPPDSTVRAYLEVTKSVVTLDQWRNVVDKALRDALAGDYRARQWISDELGSQRLAGLAAERAAGATPEQADGAPPDLSTATPEELAVIRRVLERGRPAASQH